MGRVPEERSRWLGRHVLPHEPALRAWLRRRKLEGLEVDDIIQETYSRLIGAPDVAHVLNAKNYTFQIANSVVIDHLRRQKIVDISAVPDLEDLNIISEAPSPEREIIDRDELRLLVRTIVSLPAKVRETIILRKVQELSQREVAARMGVTESTVEKHMSRAYLAILNQFRASETSLPRPSSGATPSRRNRKPNV